MAKRTKRRQSVTLDADLCERIDRLVAATHDTFSGWCNKHLREALDDEELGVQVLTDPVTSHVFNTLFRDRDTLRGFARLLGEQLSDDQLRLFTSRLDKLTGQKPRAAKPAVREQWPPKGRRGRG